MVLALANDGVEYIWMWNLGFSIMVATEDALSDTF